MDNVVVYRVQGKIFAVNSYGQKLLLKDEKYNSMTNEEIKNEYMKQFNILDRGGD